MIFNQEDGQEANYMWPLPLPTLTVTEESKKQWIWRHKLTRVGETCTKLRIIIQATHRFTLPWPGNCCCMSMWHHIIFLKLLNSKPDTLYCKSLLSLLPHGSLPSSQPRCPGHLLSRSYRLFIKSIKTCSSVSVFKCGFLSHAAESHYDCPARWREATPQVISSSGIACGSSSSSC